MNSENIKTIPKIILHRSIAGRYRPVKLADGPITARCRVIKNASWDQTYAQRLVKLVNIIQNSLTRYFVEKQMLDHCCELQPI